VSVDVPRILRAGGSELLSQLPWCGLVGQSSRDEKMSGVMETVRRSLWSRVYRTIRVLFWIFVAALLMNQLLVPARLLGARASALDDFQQRRHSRVIAMIHRQDT
jgi:hypothetical protein